MNSADSHPRRCVKMVLGYYHVDIHRGIAQYATQAGWWLDAAAYHGGTAYSIRGCNGMIVHSAGRREFVEMMESSNVPIVDLSSQIAGASFPSVLEDNAGIGREGARHLLERGFVANLAFYFPYPNEPAVRRAQAFEQIASSAGAKYWPLTGPSGKGSLMAWLVQQLAELPHPLGVMAENDDRAMDVLRACQSAGLNVPQQVAVFGVGNDPLVCGVAPIPLSSIDGNRFLRGFRAAKLLDRLMNGARPPKRPIIIPHGDLVVRLSTDVYAVDNPLVRAAAEFIRDNYARPLWAPAVAGAVGISVRQLHNLFRQHMGRSVADEIRRIRLEKALPMLASGDRKVDTVAKAVGMGSASHLTRVFKRERGFTARKR